MLNVALIGCGDMGRTHAVCLSRMSNVRLHTCCDTDVDRARELAEHFTAIHFCTDATEIFNDASIDAVYVLSRTDAHLDDCLRTLKSAKHLFVEKPLALTLDQAQEIATAAQQTSCVAMAGFKFRFYTLIERAWRTVSTPFLVSVQIVDDPWPEEFWANCPEQGGGNVISQGVHGADLLHFFARSEPIAVSAVGGNYHQKTGVVDNLAAVFHFDNGCAGSLVIGDCGRALLQGKFACTLSGSQGTVNLDQRFSRLGYQLRDGSSRIETAEEDGFYMENLAFIDAISRKAPSPCDIDQGLMAQAMMEAAIESARLQSVIEIHRDRDGSVLLRRPPL
ncbi:Gfo/Idh/MocA family oxidoreductase [candidate division KSB1 bacterium]|nr:Gfo/Idh/MocA family oxidoreductase [candidate division KSB1 bacterium]